MIAINARYLLRDRPTGVQRAADQLARALVAADPGTCRLIAPPEGLGRIAAQLWEQSILPQVARRLGCRALLNPMQTAPLVHAGLRQIVVVHDLHFLRRPEWFGRTFRTWNRHVTLRAIRRADHVVAVSDHVLADVRAAGVAPSRSSRVYDIGPEWVGGADPDPATPSILCVNAFQPHKNLERVLQAFVRLRRLWPRLELRIAGRPQENFAAPADLAATLRIAGVRLLGYLSDAELRCEYRRATLLCYPSLSEGFGLPVLEAAAVGTPVVTARAGALPEIAGDGALYAYPWSVESLVGTLRQALGLSPEARAKLVDLARANLARFSSARAVSAYRRLFASVVGAVEPAASAGVRSREVTLS